MFQVLLGFDFLNINYAILDTSNEVVKFSNISAPIFFNIKQNEKVTHHKCVKPDKSADNVFDVKLKKKIDNAA
jgi:hypothetical protein